MIPPILTNQYAYVTTMINCNDNGEQTNYDDGKITNPENY